MKTLIYLALFLFSYSSVFAESNPVSCETGDPSGGGPQAYITFSSDESAYSAVVVLYWNPKNIELAPTKHLKTTVMLKPAKKIKDPYGEEIIQTPLRLNSDLLLEYNYRPNGEPLSANLKSLSKLFPDIEMSCL